ncbi:MAG: ABC transporter ATP-binding protein [Deltaproteobacteria bacterium]|nr:ABC transporter ATP-binding protein [Deltaproteobacteria bacterium]
MSFIEIKNLSVKYGKTRVVKGFKLNVEKGQVVSFVGESGSGKTTVARSIMGLLPKAASVERGSSIVLDGDELLNYSPKDWSKIRGTKIAMIFQDSGNMLNPIRTIGNQFAEYILAYKSVSKKEALAQAEELLLKTGLRDPKSVLANYPFNLSGGMRQRVGIAMAMTFNPELLLADEPTSALDVTTQKQVIAELLELQKEHHMTIILVTHNLGVASFISDNIVVLKNGGTAEIGSPMELLNNPKNPYTKSLLEAIPSLVE